MMVLFSLEHIILIDYKSTIQFDGFTFKIFLLAVLFFPLLPHFYRRQRSWGKVIFSEACVKNSVHGGLGGACMPGGMCGRGHAWRGGCAWQGGMHGGVCGRGCAWQGACVVGGHAWGACMAGVHGRGVCMVGGHAWWGVCMAEGCACHAHPPCRYYGHGIQSMSGRYASYWNAFLSFKSLKKRDQSLDLYTASM